MSTPAAMSSPEYLALKAEILLAFQEYNKKLAESSGYASNFYSFAGMATDMCVTVFFLFYSLFTNRLSFS